MSTDKGDPQDRPAASTGPADRAAANPQGADNQESAEPITPIILDGHAEEFTPAPTRPGQMVMRPAAPIHAAIRGGVALALVAGGVVNLVFGGQFPSNAPVESVIMFLLSVDMFVGAVVLGVFAVMAGIRRSVPVAPERTSPMAIAGLALTGVAFLGWLIFGLSAVIRPLSQGTPLRYADIVGVLMFLGVPWIVGLVFGTLSLRSGGRLTGLLGGLAIALGLILVLIAVTASVLYGLGLTD